jgi:hypothetical protein
MADPILNMDSYFQITPPKQDLRILALSFSQVLLCSLISCIFDASCKLLEYFEPIIR